MPNHKAAAKSLLQDDRRRMRNRAAKSRILTLSKKVLSCVQGGNKEEAETACRTAISAIDRAAKRHRLHANNAARKKSSLTRLVSSMS